MHATAVKQTMLSLVQLHLCYKGHLVQLALQPQMAAANTQRESQIRRKLVQAVEQQRRSDHSITLLALLPVVVACSRAASCTQLATGPALLLLLQQLLHWLLDDRYVHILPLSKLRRMVHAGVGYLVVHTDLQPVLSFFDLQAQYNVPHGLSGIECTLVTKAITASWRLAASTADSLFCAAELLLRGQLQQRSWNEHNSQGNS